MLADGTTFEGEAIGADPEGGIATGEVVFNTALSGYQEIITDPSYAGQIITFTYPHIGNYGVTPLDDESAPALLPAASSSASWPAAAATGAPRPTSTGSSAPPRRARHRAASTPAASPATSATPAPCPARSARRTRPR